MKKALLIIDMQNDFIYNKNSPVYIPNGINIIPPIINTTNYFINKKCPVILIKTVHKKDKSNWGKLDIQLNRKYCIENSKGSSLISELNNENYIDIEKHTYSGFYNTELENTLNKLKIDTLYFAGLTTGCCISSTARDAYYKNYNLLFISDCLCSTKTEAHHLELDFFKKSLGQVICSSEIKF